MNVDEQNATKNAQNTLVIPDFVLFGESDSHLVLCPGQTAKVHPRVKDALVSLTQKAAKAGFDMRVASGFRSFERQLVIWNDKACGLRPVMDAEGHTINMESLDDNEKMLAILRWSALPGASRHHWGTDVDIYDASRLPGDYQLQLTIEETQGSGPCVDFHRWLTDELQQHSQDFFRPYIAGAGSILPEPWHLSYAPLARVIAAQLTLECLREKIRTADIALKDNILKNLEHIFDNYIKPYR